MRRFCVQKFADANISVIILYRGMFMRKIKTKISTASEEKSTGIRPTNLSEYIGQENIRKNLQISISAAKVRNKSLDHFLFSGPPGLGKTSLAMIVAAEMKS